MPQAVHKENTNSHQASLGDYACPMHPEVVSVSPGTCPKCHMALEPVDSSTHEYGHHDHKPNIYKKRFWVSLILTVPTVFLSPAIQSWLGFDFNFWGSQYVSAILGAVIFVYGGSVFLKSARGEIAARRPGMMTLISMAITVALLYSLLITLKAIDGMDFWWELATLVTIMLLGHWIEMNSIDNAQGALGELAKLLPDEAELVSGDGNSSVVPLGGIKAGDVIRLRPGSSAPVDGVVTEGSSEVNESMLTGESKLVSKTIGSKVIGGTINTDGSLLIKVTKTGEQTALAGIMKIVEEAQKSKSKAEVLADRAAYYLFYLSVGVAVLTAIGWAIAGESAGFILERVVTVLIIACPHALGLAIPLVTAISTTHAAKNGLLVRQRMALEAARNVDMVLFDKTGTLTLGRQGVVDVFAAPGVDSDELLSLVSGVEKESEHSIAKALVAYAQEKGHSPLPVSEFKSLPGRGVTAKYEGRDVYIGGPNLIEERQLALGEELTEVSNQAALEGKTVVYVAKESMVIGLIALADVIREESHEAVNELLSQGYRVAMLTGDSNEVAKWVSSKLGLKEYFSQVLPGGKAGIVKKLQSEGVRVAMVGDGVNDAPALTQADIGIAVGAGTDVAIESADIVLAGNDPRGISKIISLSKSTYRKMIQNLAWALSYNMVALPLAAGVAAGTGFMLSPAVGAVLMSLSTIIVAINAQFLRRLKL